MMADDHIVPDRQMYTSVIKSLSRAKRSVLIPKVSNGCI